LELNTKIAPRHPLYGKDVVIHMIKLHLHPFGESVEIRDLTTMQTVWIGYAKAAAGRKALIDTPSYSDQNGLRIYANHSYAVITKYHNTSHETIGGMGVLRVYVADPSTLIH